MEMSSGHDGVLRGGTSMKFNNHRARSTVLCALVFALAGCGNKRAVPSYLPPVGEPIVENPMGEIVIKSRGSFDVATSADSFAKRFSLISNAVAATGSQGVTIVNATAVSFELDKTGFVVPAVSNAVLDFGNLAISKLQDNNLKVCGSNGKTKCTKAFLRIYTTGVAGAGIYNSDDQYGAPLSAQLSGSAVQTVGLDPAGAVVMQTYTIPSNKKVLRLSDFSPVPRYNVKSDFTDAGAGDYSTTIVVEYGLSL